jgi:hypothetical protein
LRRITYQALGFWDVGVLAKDLYHIEYMVNLGKNLAVEIGFLSFFDVILFSCREPWRLKPNLEFTRMRAMYRI